MKHDARLVLASALTNFAMGLLYCWTLFAEPIATELKVSIADISSVPAVSLLAFTLGVNLGPVFAHRVAPAQFTWLVFAGTAAGIALVAVSSSVFAVLLGFGAFFGIASGLGYGHALRMAQASSPSVKGIAIGICVTSFALTAIVLAFLADRVIQSVGVRLSFAALSAGVVVVSLAVWALSKNLDLEIVPQARETDSLPGNQAEFLRLMLAFFSMCFVGLAVMANTGVVLRDFGVSTSAAAKGIAIFNVSYVVGSLFGGRIAETLGGRTTIIAILTSQILIVASVLLAPAPASAWMLVIVAGVALGATASVFPVYLAQRFGNSSVSRLFARLIISYGVAGFVSPWLSMLLRDKTGANDTFLTLSILVTIMATILLWRTGQRSFDGDR